MTEIDISGVMKLQTADSSIITSTDGCGEMRQEIQMQDLSQNIVCENSDFDTRLSGKKICHQNGLEMQVLDHKTLKVLANSLQQLGIYKLWIDTHHVDSTGTKLWSIRATPLTLTIIESPGYCGAITLCSLKIEG